MRTIDIGNDFSATPHGRFSDDGPFHGERFRQEFLIPALQSGEKVAVIIDTAVGYGTSFLEEAFGGLVRKGYSKEFLSQNLEVKTPNNSEDYDFYVELIWEYINNPELSVC